MLQLKAAIKLFHGCLLQIESRGAVIVAYFIGIFGGKGVLPYVDLAPRSATVSPDFIFKGSL